MRNRINCIKSLCNQKRSLNYHGKNYAVKCAMVSSSKYQLLVLHLDSNIYYHEHWKISFIFRRLYLEFWMRIDWYLNRIINVRMAVVK